MAESLSISFRQGDGSIEHNNREFIADNVDSARTPDNIIYVQRDLREMYHELFDAALEKYNSEQTRKSRKIPDYYEHIKKGKKEKLFQEVIVTFGNSDVCTLGSENWNKAIELLDDYARNFEKRNPQLKVANMVMHLDEACPHLHIDFVPVCYGQEQGLETRVSMKRAIQQMLGITGTSQKQTEAIIWGNAEREEMEKILQAHQLNRWVMGAYHQHLPREEYIQYAQNLKALNTRIKTLTEKNPADLTNEEVGEIINQNKLLRESLIATEQEMKKYKNHALSDFVEIKIYNDEKRQYVIAGLVNQRIPYVEDEHGIYVPECFEQAVRKTADSFKPMKNPPLREQAKFMIDRLIYSATDFENLLELLKSHGYEIKRGKYLAIKPPNAVKFMRLKTFGEQYTEYALADRIRDKDIVPNDIRRSTHYPPAAENAADYCNEMEKAIYSVQLQTIEYVRTLRITPIKSRSNEPYSLMNDTALDTLSGVLVTLAENGISSRDKLYKVQLELQDKVDDCADEDELFELKAELARVDVAVRTYEEIVEGNFIDNLVRSERERKAAEQPNVANVNPAADFEKKNAAPEKAQEPKHTQTTNKKRGRR